jgi:hypothetical protein
MFQNHLKFARYLSIFAITSVLLISCSSSLVAIKSSDWRESYMKWSPERLCKRGASVDMDLVLGTFTPDAVLARRSLMQEVILKRRIVCPPNKSDTLEMQRLRNSVVTLIEADRRGYEESQNGKSESMEREQQGKKGSFSDYPLSENKGRRAPIID